MSAKTDTWESDVGTDKSQRLLLKKGVQSDAISECFLSVFT